MTSQASRFQLIGTTVILLGQLNACTSWRVQSVTPEQLFARETPKEVRVQHLDEKQLVLKKPQLVGDSLVGKTDGTAAAAYLQDISEIAVRRPNMLKTLGLIVGIIAAPFAAVGITCAITSECDFSVN
jgi:hypothetical protein